MMTTHGRGAALWLAALTILGARSVVSAQPATPDAGATGEMFGFVILGEREPGPGAGAELVEQGAQIAGWLGADMTVCLTSDPDREALDAAGIAWHSPPGPGEGAIARSFDHKWTHLVLLGSGAAPEQAAWLRSDLASSNAEMVYVFVREPRWLDEGSGWDEVERVLFEDERPVSVFASGARYVRDDGQRRNVRYRTVGPTGAFTNLEYEAASFQHVTWVSVRHGGEAVAVIPIKGVRTPEDFGGAGFDALDAFRASDWASLVGGVRIGREAGAESEMTIELVGTAEMPIDYAAAIDAGPGWSFSQTAFRGRLDPGQRVVLPVQAIAPAIGRARPDVTLTVRAKYPLASGGEQAVTRRERAPVEVVGLASDTGEGEPGVLVLNGRSAVRVDLEAPSGAFTIEGWVKGREPQPGRAMALFDLGGRVGFGVYWSDGAEGERTLPVGVVRSGGGLAETRARAAWAWGEWTHVALCFDGRESRLYVGGELQSRAAVRGAPTPTPMPLFIGAGAADSGGADDYFFGRLDDVRLSDIARYDADFTPPDRLEADGHTRMLLRFDARVGGLFPDASGSGAHGWAIGGAAISKGDR